MEKNAPQHIALVMDGNRRWATERGLPKLLGHTEGAKAIKPVVKACKEMGVPYVTLWALSTENLKNRSEQELSHLFSLFKRLVEYLGDFEKEGVRMNMIGDMAGLPTDVQEVLFGMVERTKENKELTLTLAVNYGGKDEMVRAMRKMVEQGVSSEHVTAEHFEQFLDTAGIPNPELIIRTGGHSRLSGYLLWQSEYAELYFTKTYWPAFTPKELREIVEWYYEVQRNRGA